MEDNLDVAMRENSVMKLEQDQTVYQGFDNSIESYIMFELMQHDYMDNSLIFAEKVQNEFVGTLKRANRGVRQAAFWVLLQSACPGVLIEIGFISNEEEEKWLASKAGQQGIVKSIFDAFGIYYNENKNK
jgi:N-acetylmuramoyl-L-alanine amidase